MNSIRDLEIEIARHEARNLVTGKCTSASRGSSWKKHGRLFRFSRRSKTIEIAEPLMAIYFQLTRHLHTHTHLDWTPSAFLTPTRLLSKPIPRVAHPRGHVDRDTPHLLSPPRHPSSTRITTSSLFLSFSRHTDTKWIYVRAHRSISRRLFSKPLAERRLENLWGDFRWMRYEVSPFELLPSRVWIWKCWIKCWIVD